MEDNSNFDFNKNTQTGNKEENIIEELRRAEKVHRYISEYLSELIFLCDINGNAYFVTSTCKNIFGYTPEEMKTFPFTHLVYEEDIPYAYQKLNELVTTNKEQKNIELRLKRKDGSIFWGEFSGSIYSDGNIKEIIGSLRDITERKRITQELNDLLERQKALLFTIPDIVMEVDEQKIYKWANKAGYDFFGPDVIGKEAAYYFEGEQETYNIVEPLFKGEENVILLESWQRRKDGAKRLLSWHCRVLKDLNGKVTGALSIARDITEQRKMEQTLIESESSIRRKLQAILEPEGDIGLLELNDILDKEKIQNLLDDFYKIFKIGIEIYDINWVPLVSTDRIEICKNFHLHNEKTLKNCLKADLKILEDISEGEFREVKCQNNLNEIVIPIYIGGKILGYIFVGQFLYEDETFDEKFFLEQAKNYGFDTNKYIEYIREIPRFSKEQINQIISFVIKLCEILTSLSFSSIKLSRISQKKENSIKEITKLSTVIESANYGTAIADLNYTLIYVNNTFAELHGWKKEELIGKSIFDLHTPEQKPKIEELLDELKTKGGFVDVEVDHKRKDGSIFPALMSSQVIKDSSGKPEFLSATLMDLTEKKRIDNINKIQSEIAYKMISADSLEDFASFLKEKLGTIIDTTNFFLALYNEIKDTLTAILWKDEKDTFTTWPATNSLSGIVAKRGETLMLLKNDIEELQSKEGIHLLGTKPEQWLGVPIKLKEKVLGVIVVQSYKKRDAFNHETKEILESVSNYLSLFIERKIKEEELIKAKEKAEESDRLKSSFLANMSHEIRTPMNGILGFLSLLEQPDLTSETKDRYIKILQKSGERLINTINDIIDVSKIEAGQISVTLTDIDINHLMNYLYNLFKPETDEKGLELILKNPFNNDKIIIKSDKYKLNTILTNLLKNAIKFTDVGSVEFGYSIIKDNIKFFVRDTGIGIPENKQKIIFDRFTQVDDSPLSRTYEGSGLGLTLAKAYTEMLDGYIWVESELGSGSTFYVLLPYNPVTEQISSTITQSEIKPLRSGNKIKILVTEDDDISFEFVNILLVSEGYEVIRAFSGIEAIKLFKKYPDIALIIMDVKLPLMSGYTATSKIREFDSKIPIIAVTAYALSPDRDKALEAGCNDYLPKPITRTALLEVLNKYLKHYKLN